MAIKLLRDPIKYPVIEVFFTTPQGKVFFARNCCFHDLLSEDQFDLAGMGLAIIGNVCQMLGKGEIRMDWDAFIHVRIAPGAEPRSIAWPGMPDARPLKLDLAKMPFDAAMFIDEKDGFAKRRPDRLALMDRIGAIWVPELMTILSFSQREVVV